MDIIKIQEENKTILSLSGNLDTTTASQFQDALIPELNIVHHLILDFKELVYLSSAGLRVLLLGVKTAKQKGTQMVLRNLSVNIQKVIRITGLDTVLVVE
jgi:anti-anti-sigma factor